MAERIHLEFRECFEITGASPSSIHQASTYFQTVRSKIGRPLAERICSTDKLRAQQQLRDTAEAIKVDGKDADWDNVTISVSDPEGNVLPYQQERPSSPDKSGLDIKDVTVIKTRSRLVLRIRTHGSPRPDSGAWYFLHLSNELGVRVADIATDGRGMQLTKFAGGKPTRATRLGPEAFRYRTQNVIEWSTDLSKVTLHDTEKLWAWVVSFDGGRNLYNSTKPFLVTPVSALAGTTPAHLLTLYAQQETLQAGELLPAAIALTESWPYHNVQEHLRDRVVADGIAMLRFGRLHSRSGQNFEGALAWSNRSFLWGALSGWFADDRGKFTREGYEFMFLDPAVLQSVRKRLGMQFGPITNSADLALAIDTWSGQVHRYRWKLQNMRKWPTSPAHKKLLEEIAAEVRAGKDIVTRVDGKPVYHWWIGSANFQWQYFLKNGHYLGPCGDRAVMSMLVLKAFGEADIAFFWNYGPSDQFSHTLVGYLERESNRWRGGPLQVLPAGATGRGYFQFSLPPLSDQPQHGQTTVEGRTVYVSERIPLQPQSAQSIAALLKAGIPSSTIRGLLENPKVRSREGRSIPRSVEFSL